MTRRVKLLMVARLLSEYKAPVLLTSGALLGGAVGAIWAERAWRRWRAVR